MAGSARIGQFSLVSSSYGAPVGIAKPADNVTTAPTPPPPGTNPNQTALDLLYQQLKDAAARP